MSETKTAKQTNQDKTEPLVKIRIIKKATYQGVELLTGHEAYLPKSEADVLKENGNAVILGL